MANPSLQIGNSNWAIKKDNLLGYSTAGTRFLPIPITMTRASAGTRVNPQGLVETVELLGSELVTNGNFELNSDWNNFSTPTTSEQSTEQSHTGTYSWKVIADATQEGIFSPNNFSITNGNSYSVSLWIYSVSGNSIKSGLNNTNVSVFTERTVIAGQWTNITYEATATSTGASYISILSQNSLNFYVDNVSVKESTKNDLARVDYTGSTSSLLAEPQRTNLEADSSDFSQWSKFNTLVVTDDVISLDGTQNADFIKADANNTAHTIFNNYTVSNATSYTFTVYVKKNNLSYFQITSGQGFGNYFSNFNLDNGTVEVSTHIRASIDLVSNGWYRCTVELLSSTTTGQVYPSIIKNATDSRNASNGDLLDKGYYVWGAQLEEGSYATSYIPTSGSTVTRVQDQYTKTGISDKIGAEGVLFIEMAALSNDLTNRVISLNDGTSSNRLMLYFNSSSNTISVAGIGGTIIYTVSDETSFNKMAVRYKTNDITLWVDGESRGTPITSVTIPTFTALKSNSGSGSSTFYGKVKQLQIYDTYLSNGDMQILTT